MRHSELDSRFAAATAKIDVRRVDFREARNRATGVGRPTGVADARRDVATGTASPANSQACVVTARTKDGDDTVNDDRDGRTLARALARPTTTRTSAQTGVVTACTAGASALTAIARLPTARECAPTTHPSLVTA
jgi:hypothetical protein